MNTNEYQLLINRYSAKLIIFHIGFIIGTFKDMDFNHEEVRVKDCKGEEVTVKVSFDYKTGMYYGFVNGETVANLSID